MSYYTSLASIFCTKLWIIKPKKNSFTGQTFVKLGHVYSYKVYTHIYL